MRILLTTYMVAPLRDGTPRPSGAARLRAVGMPSLRSAPIVIAILMSLAAGCGPSFELTLPERFVRLRHAHQLGGYELRATTPDGVVVGVEVIENAENGTLDFWKEAVLTRLRDQQGYALLSEESVRAANGQEGHLMRFGRDLSGHSYRYTVALFVSPTTAIHLVEAGGREEPYTALEPQIEASIERMRF